LNTKEKPRRFRASSFVIGGSLLCVLLVVILFDPVALVSDAIAVARIRWELPRARDKWEARALATYRIHVKGAVPLACFVDAELTVRGGGLAGVRSRENPLVPDLPFVQVSQDDWEVQGCSYEDLTIEDMFLRVEADLERIGILGGPLVVKFDENRGFVSEYRSGRASYGGILGATASECCTWFVFDNFTESPP
jgi:hypothetical protein